MIGSNNSAHDICAALWEAGADVTMVQRSSTHIVRSDTLMDIGLGALYSEQAVAAGMTTEKADLIFASLPYRIMHEFQIPLYDQMRERDADFYDRLEKAGFMLDWGEDGSGLFMKYLRRGSGYYIDVGASELVADGEIKLQVGHGRRASPRTRWCCADGTRAAGRPRRLRHRLRLDERLGRRPDLPGGRRQGRQGLGPRLRTPPRTPARGRASSATCGSRRSRRRCGSTAATCTSRGTTRSTSRCSSRRALEGIDTPVYGLQEVHHLS